MVGDESETEMLRDGGQDQLSFHEGERIADALARTEAEREVGKTRDFFEEIAALPAFGKKLFGMIVPAGIAVDDPRNGGDAGASGDGEAGELMIFDGEASHGPGGWIES